MKKLVIALAAVIVVLLGIFFFYNPTQEPTIPGIAVTAPAPNAVITSPVAIEGSVTGGGWFFEAVFPVKILDATGETIGEGQAQADPPASWTSTGTVPFSASVTFTGPRTATGTIVLSKDNPSGDPANAASTSVPVQF